MNTVGIQSFPSPRHVGRHTNELWPTQVGIQSFPSPRHVGRHTNELWPTRVIEFSFSCLSEHGGGGGGKPTDIKHENLCTDMSNKQLHEQQQQYERHTNEL